MICFASEQELEDKSKQDILKEYGKLLKEKERLEKELRKYKNAHTPSSQKKFEKVTVQGLKVGRKKGKKSGHKGRTNKQEKPNTIIPVTTDKNPATGNIHIEETGYVEQITITDFKILKVVTQYDCFEYRDLDTGETFIARHPDMPPRGIYGKNVLALASFLRFKCRVPYEKIASLFATAFRIPMTAPTAMDIVSRTAEKVRPAYQKLKRGIRKERAVYADETSAKRNGLPGWLWGFFSLMIALVVFNKERGGDIVEKILGKEFKALIGCDGWQTYVSYSKKTGALLQRCWAHILREVEEKCKGDKSLEKAHEWLCDIFSKVKEAREYQSQEMREQFYVELVSELDSWIQVYKSHKKLRKLAQKIENGREFWFTCVLHLEIEPTNNRAERGLRSWRVLEKIIGTLRSDQGRETTEILLSLFSTWDLRKINGYQKLVSLL